MGSIVRRRRGGDEIATELADVQYPRGARPDDVFPETRGGELAGQAQRGGVAEAVEDAGEEGRCVEEGQGRVGAEREVSLPVSGIRGMEIARGNHDVVSTGAGFGFPCGAGREYQDGYVFTRGFRTGCYDFGNGKIIKIHEGDSGGSGRWCVLE